MHDAALVSAMCKMAFVLNVHLVSLSLLWVNVKKYRYVTFTALPEILLRAATQSLVRAANALRVLSQVQLVPAKNPIPAMPVVQLLGAIPSLDFVLIVPAAII